MTMSPQPGLVSSVAIAMAAPLGFELRPYADLLQSGGFEKVDVMPLRSLGLDSSPDYTVAVILSHGLTDDLQAAVASACARARKHAAAILVGLMRSSARDPLLLMRRGAHMVVPISVPNGPFLRAVVRAASIATRPIPERPDNVQE